MVIISFCSWGAKNHNCEANVRDHQTTRSITHSQQWPPEPQLESDNSLCKYYSIALRSLLYTGHTRYWTSLFLSLNVSERAVAFGFIHRSITALSLSRQPTLIKPLVLSFDLQLRTLWRTHSGNDFLGNIVLMNSADYKAREMTDDCLRSSGTAMSVLPRWLSVDICWRPDGFPRRSSPEIGRPQIQRTTKRELSEVLSSTVLRHVQTADFH